MLIICVFIQGRKYNWSRKQCDIAFRTNMDKLCLLKDAAKRSNAFSSWNIWDKLRAIFKVAKELTRWTAIKCGTLENCIQGSKVYYISVDQFGHEHFGSNDEACNLECAKVHGAPENLL